MFNIGLGEMIVIGLIALLVFGPERLPELARQAAHIFNQVRGAADEVQRAILTETQPITKPFEDIRDEIKGTARPIQDLQQEIRAAPNMLDYKPVSRSEGENDHSN